jgi:hypothetical protein
MGPGRLVVALVVTLAATACGSNGSSTGGASARSSTTASTASTASTDPTLAADGRIATSGLIRASDLPGWQATKRAPSLGSQIKAAAARIPECATFVAGLRDGRARARSTKFTKGGTTVDGEVDVYATVPELRAQLELYRDPAIIGGLQALFTKALTASAPAGATVGTVSVSPIAVDPSGDGGYGFRITASVTRDGTPQTILSDLVGVTSGRVGASLTVTGSDGANLAQAETTLLPILTQRIQDAPRR